MTINIVPQRSTAAKASKKIRNYYYFPKHIKDQVKFVANNIKSKINNSSLPSDTKKHLIKMLNKAETIEEIQEINNIFL